MVNIESQLFSSGLKLIAGVDEAGRGPCAGPLVVAAVILENPNDPRWSRINDSKKLAEKVRDELFAEIIEHALSYSIIEIAVTEIDSFGLHKSNLEGMRRAVNSLQIAPEYVLTDGYPIAGLEVPTLAVWKGDQVAVCISAASILAKVYRDRVMVQLDSRYPGYGLSKHKGYITPAHSRALIEFGPTDIHRRSFKNISGLAQ
ncbi:MAG: ribonuclease HII [Actinomycetes bacterium]